VTIVVILALGYYLGVCYLFYSCLKNARVFALGFINSQSQGLIRNYDSAPAVSNQPGYNPVGYAPNGISGQVVYPGQAYSGNLGQGVFVGQPVYPNNPHNGNLYPLSGNLANREAGNGEIRENQPFVGQPYVIQPEHAK
jgi:hypothetical protein